VIADFDGDALADIVVGHLTSSALSFLPGNGNGTFGPKQNVAAGGSGVLSIAGCGYRRRRPARRHRPFAQPAGRVGPPQQRPRARSLPASTMRREQTRKASSSRT
jgi:hypothetical protein